MVADGDADESGEEEDGTDEPLTDYQYTDPPQIVELREQDTETTLRTVSAPIRSSPTTRSAVPKRSPKSGRGRLMTSSRPFRDQCIGCRRAGTPLIVSQGKIVHLHIANNGYESYSFHTHGHRFTVIETDGSPIPQSAQYDEDVIDIAPSERYTLEFADVMEEAGFEG